MKQLPTLKISSGASLSLVVVSTLAVLWLSYPRQWYGMTIALVLFVLYIGWNSRFNRPNLPPQGVPHDSRAYGLLIGITATLVATMVLISLFGGFFDSHLMRAALDPSSADFFPYWILKVATYAGCLAQQAILWWIVFPLCAAVTGTWLGTALLASSLFALLHLPNPLVTVASLGLGLLSFLAFRKGVSIFAMAACHLILAFTFKLAFPDYLHLRLITGANAIPKLQQLLYISQHRLVPKTERYWSDQYYREAGGTDASYMRALYKELMGRVDVSDETIESWVLYGRNRRLQDIVLTFVHEHVLLEKRTGGGPATKLALAE